MHDSIGLPQLSQRTASSPAITLSPYPKFLYFVEVGSRLKYSVCALYAVVSRYVVAIAAAAAAGIISWVMLFGDIPYRMQDGKDISVAGRMVCLPHEQGLFPSPETQECTFGFRGQNGEHYWISNLEEISNEELRWEDNVGGSQEFTVSGTFTYGDYRNYDVVGTIIASEAELLFRQ